MTGPRPAPDSTLERVRIWDPLLRIFHWSLMVCVMAAWLLGRFGPDVMTLHFYFGYAVLGLLAFRVLWGFVGPKYARFASFAYGPVRILRYAGRMLRREPSYWRGHNPMGGFFALAMLAVLAVHAGCGLFADPEDYINVGPLAEWVGIDVARAALSWHGVLSWVVLGLVLLHVAAIMFYWLWKRENLIEPMLKGRKRLPPEG